MANLSKIKREKMLEYLEKLKEINNDDENIRAITEIENALNEKKYGLVWEEHSEKVDEELVHNIPIFVEDENRKITANEDETYNLLLEGWDMDAPSVSDMPFKGNTVIGNDVWIGQNAVILPGVNIEDGAIIGANSVVGTKVAPYTIVAGNPAKVIRKRFDEELIDLMLRFKWWDKSIREINSLIPILTCSDLEKVREELKAKL